MNLSKVKMIATDMDGTLLNTNHEVSTRFFNVFEALQKHNILFVAASGRPHYSIVDKLEKIKDDIIVVAENGGVVIKNNNILLTKTINKNDLTAIVDQFNKLAQVNAIFCTQEKAYFLLENTALAEYLAEFYPNYEVITSINDIKVDVIKIALYHDTCSETYLLPHIKNIDAIYDVRVSSKNWLDISSKSANKGFAIKMLQDKYNIKTDETLIFGDYNNDIEMLKTAKYSYAMANAHPNVKQTANYQTKSNNEFGVEVILEQLLEAKKQN